MYGEPTRAPLRLTITPLLLTVILSERCNLPTSPVWEPTPTGLTQLLQLVYEGRAGPGLSDSVPLHLPAPPEPLLRDWEARGGSLARGSCPGHRGVTWKSSSLVWMSYTRHMSFSSTTANLLREALMSRQRTAVACFSRMMAKRLSTKILRIWQNFRGQSVSNHGHNTLEHRQVAGTPRALQAPSPLTAPEALWRRGKGEGVPHRGLSVVHRGCLSKDRPRDPTDPLEGLLDWGQSTTSPRVKD